VTEKTEKYKPMMQPIIIVSFHDVAKNEKTPKIPYVTFKCYFNANSNTTTQNET